MMNVYVMKGCNGDLEKESHVFRMAGTSQESGASANTIQQSYFYLQNANLDFQVRNKGTTHTVWVDMYHFHCKKDVPLADLTAGTKQIRNLLENVNLLDLPDGTATTTTTGVSYREIGVTPFQCQHFCKYFTIDKKQTVQLGPGEIIRQTIRSNKKMYYNRDLVDNLAAKKGQTQGVVFVYRSQYESEETEFKYPNEVVDFSAQWTYSIKRMVRTADTIYKDPALA